MKSVQNPPAPISQEQPRKLDRLPRRVGPRSPSVVKNRTAWLILLAAVAMTVLEGAFRKWVLPQNGATKYLMYFSKDIIFACLLFIPKRGTPSHATLIFRAWLFPGCILLGIGIMLSTMTYGINPVGAILTLRAVIVLPVIAWLVIDRLEGFSLNWALWLLALFTLINFPLSVEQNSLPADHILNRYAADTDEKDIAVVKSGVRATGTFAYLTGLGALSSVGIWTGLALMSQVKKTWQYVLVWLVIAAGFGCGLAAVSRAPVYIGLAMVGIWSCFSIHNLLIAWRGLIVGVVCVVLAGIFGLSEIFQNLVQGFFDRLDTVDDTAQGRSVGQIQELFDVLTKFPLGHGFGSEQIAGQFFSTGTAAFNNYENQLPRLAMETGFIGVVGYVVICGGAIVALQSAKQAARSESARSVLLATQILLVPFFYANLIYNHIASSFVWIIFATVMAAMEWQVKGRAPAPNIPRANSRKTNRPANHSQD